MSDFHRRKQSEAASRIEDLLALPMRPQDDCYSTGECFDPWELFPALYGSYNADFDVMAITVLEDIHKGGHRRNDLAGEMFREMLCSANLCSYGTSPRHCFATTDFKTVLPRLVERWKQYARIMWGDYVDAQLRR